MKLFFTPRWTLHFFVRGPATQSAVMHSHVDTGLVYGLRESLWYNSRGTVGGYVIAIEFGRWAAIGAGVMRR